LPFLTNVWLAWPFTFKFIESLFFLNHYPCLKYALGIFVAGVIVFVTLILLIKYVFGVWHVSVFNTTYVITFNFIIFSNYNKCWCIIVVFSICLGHRAKYHILSFTHFLLISRSLSSFLFWGLTDWLQWKAMDTYWIMAVWFLEFISQTTKQ
jgi:hypothetical protein